MNAEQLNRILSHLRDVHQKFDTVGKMGALRSALENIANNPVDSEAQNAYNNHLQSLTTALRVPQLNEFSVREKKLIDDANLDLMVGEVLLDRIREALTGSSITPRTALNSVVSLHNDLSNILNKVHNVAAGLAELGIGVGGPGPGVVELGLYIPRHGEDLTLEEILTEGHQLDNLIKRAYELIVGSATSPKVEYLTSSDYGFLLSIAPKVVKFLLDAIERGLRIKKLWREDQEAIKRLRELNHDEATVAELESKQNAARERELEENIRISIEEYDGVDKFRKNEITMPIVDGIKLLLKNQENGSYIDIRVESFNTVQDGDQLMEGGDKSSDMQVLIQKAQLMREIEQISKRIHLLERGNPRPETRALPRAET